MSLPKLSFRPKQDPIIIERNGYTFKQHRLTHEERQTDAAIADQVLRFIESEYQLDRKYSSTDLEKCTKKMGLSRDQIRAALTELKVSSRTNVVGGVGKAGTHIKPASISAEVGRG
jgi:hypothetical protein